METHFELQYCNSLEIPSQRKWPCKWVLEYQCYWTLETLKWRKQDLNEPFSILLLFSSYFFSIFQTSILLYYWYPSKTVLYFIQIWTSALCWTHEAMGWTPFMERIKFSEPRFLILYNLIALTMFCSFITLYMMQVIWLLLLTSGAEASFVNV